MNKKELLSRLVAIAAKEVGVKEQGGNNRGPRIVVYQQATWLKPDAWPWCAAFTAWVLREWLKDDEVLAALHIDESDAFAWRCRDASAFGWVKWAQKQGLYITDEKEPAKAGDIIVFDFSHIGIVEKDQVPGGLIQCIEGNTNGKGERDSVTGDGVWRKQRQPNTVRNLIRLLP
jgi:hypothetical protein